MEPKSIRKLPRTAAWFAAVAMAWLMSACGGGSDTSGATNTGGSTGGGIGGTVTPTGLPLLRSYGSAPYDAAPTRIFQGKDGRLLGISRIGGSYGQYVYKIVAENYIPVYVPQNSGTAFAITPGGMQTVLWNFGATATDGMNPSSLIQGRDGSLYGATTNGGLYGEVGRSPGGTLFRISPDGMETVLASFGTVPGGWAMPQSLVEGTDGNIYGITEYGGVIRSIEGVYWASGTVFKLTPQGVMTVLWNFSADSDGAAPTTLIWGADGNLYGTTRRGGQYSGGTIFKLTLDGTETVLWSFNPRMGGDLPNSLIQGSDGSLYGTTNAGGPNNRGTIFKMSTAGALTVLWDFSDETQFYSNGPNSLVEGNDGNLYGTTSGGGKYAISPYSGGGTLFRITPSGAFTTLWSFGSGTDGSRPYGLIQGSDGHLYGMTADGGIYAGGNIFRY